MYNWEKSLPTIKKNPQNLSFSSTLLAEIDRSIDGEFKLHRSRPSTEQSKIRVSSLNPSKEDVHSFRRHFVSEKLNPPPCRRNSQPELYQMSREIDFDPVPFSSSSSSSDSSSGGLSSSDVEFNQFTSVAKSRVSCFTVLRPKPVKTKTEKADCARHPFDEMPDSDGLVKSRLRAIKIDNSLKKAKQQPISPGSGRLTNFLNSLFSNNGGNPKKTKNPRPVCAETTQPTSASSSYYRSCLTTKEKTNSLGEKKTRVRFDNVIPNRVSLPRVEKADVDTDVDLDGLSDSSSDLFELDHLAMDKYGEELPVYETTHVHHMVPNRIVR